MCCNSSATWNMSGITSDGLSAWNATFSSDFTTPFQQQLLNFQTTGQFSDAFAGALIVTILPLPPPPSCPPFLVRYAANLDTGDSLIDLTNSGGNPPGNANICANVYAFSPDEQLVSCCSCPVTPDALVSLSVVSDLISNTLTPAHPSSVVIKLVPSAGAVCNAANVPAANLATGLLAWGTTRHGASGANGPVFQTTETPFSQSCLSPSELARITSFCGFIQANGSGFGICRSCRLGGQGAVK